MSSPLNESAYVIFSADGTGTARLGPFKPGERWHVTRISVTSPSPSQPTMEIYRGNDSPSLFIDRTLRGNDDVASYDEWLQPLEVLLFKWFNGTPGSAGTVILTGEREG